VKKFYFCLLISEIYEVYIEGGIRVCLVMEFLLDKKDPDFVGDLNKRDKTDSKNKDIGHF